MGPVGRVVEDGSSQIYWFEYNARGRKTKEIDPLDRETVHVFGKNNTPYTNPTVPSRMDLDKHDSECITLMFQYKCLKDSGPWKTLDMKRHENSVAFRMDGHCGKRASEV